MKSLPIAGNHDHKKLHLRLKGKAKGRKVLDSSEERQIADIEGVRKIAG